MDGRNHKVKFAVLQVWRLTHDQGRVWFALSVRQELDIDFTSISMTNIPNFDQKRDLEI